MTETPSQQKFLLLDTDAVQVTTLESNEAFTSTRVELDARAIKRIFKKLKKQGHEINEQQVSGKLLQECIQHIIAQQNFVSVWGPQLDGPPPIAQIDKPFAFTVFLDIPPEIQWPEWSKITLYRPNRDITQSMVDTEMDQQCLINGERFDRNGPTQPNDIITCNLQIVTEESKEASTIEALEILAPAPGEPTLIAGLPIPDFQQHLEKLTPGSNYTLNFEMPEDSPLHGQHCTLNLECLKIQRIEPASIEQVVELYGSPSEKILKQQIRLSMQSKFDRDQAITMVDQLFQALEEHVSVDVPEHVIKGMVQRRINQTGNEARAAGHSPDDVKAMVRGSISEWTAEARIKNASNAILILLSKELQVSMYEPLVAAEISAMAADLGRRPEEVRQEIIDQGRMSLIVSNVKKMQCLELLMDELTIKDIPAHEWETMQEVDQA